jgi:hypothetical protein
MGDAKQKFTTWVRNSRKTVTNRVDPMLGRFTVGISLWFGRKIYAARRWAGAHSAKLEISLWAFIVAIAVYQLPRLQVWLTPVLNDRFMSGLQTVAVTVGGAMIGATAIASSFVLFALQVNVERLPYGLFYRFSLDPKLLFSFALSFVAAIGGTALSLISKPSHASWLIFGELTAVFLVLRLLLLAYRRSLHLVNPIQQIAMIARQADRDLIRVDRHFRWTAPTSSKPEDSQIDTARRAAFDANPQWDRSLIDTIEHAVAFARRAGEHGDLEISAAALNAVQALNHRYVQVKGRTFFANNVFVDNPLVSDRTINATLESLRRLREAAITRRDEPQLEQILKTQAVLARIYLRIDYGPAQSKSHSLLAASYLQNSIDAASQNLLIDTAMWGVQQLGGVAKQFFITGELDEAVGSISKIAVSGMAGAVSEKHRPLTLTSMEQLRDLLLVLLRVQTRDISHAAREIRSSIAQICKLFLELPDAPLSSTHSAYLAPIYSSTSFTSLRALMTPLVNALPEAEDSEAAETIADHLAIWSDGLYQEQKEILLQAIEKRSHFTFDMIHWITGMTELLIFVSRSPHTRDHARRELQKNALWLLSTLTWIPTNQETVTFIENLSLRSEIFECALRAERDEWPDGYDVAWKLLLKWAVEGGRHQTGWGTLERWLTGLCALASRGEVDRAEQLKAELTARLSAADTPGQDMRDRAAVSMRDKAENLRTREYEHDLVERILASNDREKTRNLLQEIADILSPQPVQC